MEIRRKTISYASYKK